MKDIATVESAKTGARNSCIRRSPTHSLRAPPATDPGTQSRYGSVAVEGDG